MAGYFEITDAPDGGFRVRLLDGTGTLVAVSVKYPTKEAAVAGISWTREVAGTGLIRDMSRGGHGEIIIPKSRVAHATTRIHSHTRFQTTARGVHSR
ncbi:YegP family protein [Arthrobacter sp. NPDC056493]|uniref:YegP family protein n=1 Tax=Arthrobacter sp. NPDC056493 TaxID=3345839 RepID=UPI00366D7284